MAKLLLGKTYRITWSIDKPEVHVSHLYTAPHGATFPEFIFHLTEDGHILLLNNFIILHMLIS